MKLLVTGGAGFIGSNAASRFAAQGHHVMCVDNMSRSGADANAAWLESQHKVKTVRQDLREAGPIADTVKAFAPDAVLHCAGQVAVTTSVTNPRKDLEDNILGTFNILEAVRQHAPKAMLLYTSTNKVYGGMEDVGVALKDNRYGYVDLPNGCPETRTLDFHSPYGCSKGAADQYVHDYARIYGMRTIVFRQSCIYGYRQFGIEDQGWVAWFTIRAVQGRPVTIFGDGKQVRDVLFIEDLVNAFQAAFENINTTAGGVFNIGGGPRNTLSLLELVEQLNALTGKKLPVSFGDWRPGDQRVFVANIDKAKKEFGWAPKVSAADGVAKLHRWIADNQGLFAHLG